MKVNTKAYGAIEVDERLRVHFPYGLFGFEKVRDYILIEARQEPFMYLQSTEVSDLAFICVDPFLFRPDYAPSIDDSELAEIGIASADDALLLAIVTIPQSGGPMTANLAGPLVLNKTTRHGRQVVVQDQGWKTKHDILAELAESRK